MWRAGNRRRSHDRPTAFSAATGAVAALGVLLFASCTPDRDSDKDRKPFAPPPHDYAEARHVEDWLRHPVFGDASFDSFERVAGNPIYRGSDGYEWPVNGFYFRDPVSRHLYVYVGRYPKGYWGEGAGANKSRCEVLRSVDGGRTWQGLGPVLPEDPSMFDGDGKSAGHMPDVSVTYDPTDGRYHMVYDWATPDRRDGGIAYAWSDRPEGPFHRDKAPILRQSDVERRHGKLLGKYSRPYAATLLRRGRDWLVLGMMDDPPRGWAMFATTARTPAGPWRDPVLVRHPHGGYFHPPLLEFYPAFAHRGVVYAPATSVARNRNFQVMFMAPLESAEDPAAWTIRQHGSLWHSEDVAHEARGIWGQTFSGWVEAGHGGGPTLHAMFPSRDVNGLGTINLARRRWDRPLRNGGFYLTGHEGKSLALLRRGYVGYKLEAALRVRGVARVVWDYTAPLGPDRPESDATLHPLMLTRHMALELSPRRWTVMEVDASGKATPLATGDGFDRTRWEITFRRRGGGGRLELDGAEVWSRLDAEAAAADDDADADTHAVGDARRMAGAAGSDPEVKDWSGVGAIGLMAEEDTHVFVERFHVRGFRRPLAVPYLYTEALAGAAEDPARWRPVNSADFRFGVGAVSAVEGATAKWNVTGRRVTLWSPRGPGFGKVEVRLNGAHAATIDLHSEVPRRSAPVWSEDRLADGFHAVTLRAAEGAVPLDCLEAGE